MDGKYRSWGWGGGGRHDDEEQQQQPGVPLYFILKNASGKKTYWVPSVGGLKGPKRSRREHGGPTGPPGTIGAQKGQGATSGHICPKGL